MVLWHDMARTYRACIIGLLGVVGVLHIMYLEFAKATVMILSNKIYSTNAGGGIIICFILIFSDVHGLASSHGPSQAGPKSRPENGFGQA
jgi:hypothetical protein